MNATKVTVVPLIEVLQIVRVVDVELVDQDDPAEDPTLKPGRYCIDSAGSLWKRDDEVTNLLGGLEFDDPQLRRERAERREREKAAKRKKRQARKPVHDGAGPG